MRYLRSGWSIPVGAAAVLLLGETAAGKGDGTFQAPLRILNARTPVAVHAGDFDGDGKLELATVSGQSGNVLVFFQEPENRLVWKQVSLPVGSQVFFVRAGDFDGDGLDDLAAGDLGSTAYYVRSLGNGRFARPEQIPRSNGARWTAVGDWNADGLLDLATANLNFANLTIFLNTGREGVERFTLTQDLPGSREHSLEALDYDGDGKLDLMLGTGLGGIVPHHGRGDGTFDPQAAFLDLGCVEYIAEAGHYSRGKYTLVGDFNRDGKGDLSSTCVEFTSAYVGISRGDGSYQKTLEVQAGTAVDYTAIADLSGDGNADLAVASQGSNTLLVYLGKGDGEFQPSPLSFGPTGETPFFLISRDLDGDGRYDVVTADQGSSSLTVFWGAQGERFLESGLSLTGFSGARAMAAADLNGDGAQDLLFPRSDQSGVQVFHGPFHAAVSQPSVPIDLTGRYTHLAVGDLSGDEVDDLAGADLAAGTLLVALLDSSGAPRSQVALPAGIAPSGVVLASLDAEPALDILVPCRGSNHVAVFLNTGQGTFGDAVAVPTVERPKGAVAADLDKDGWTDLAVFGESVLAVHWASGGGRLGGPTVVLEDAARSLNALLLADLDGDSLLDAAAAEAKTTSILVFRGKGGREFEAPTSSKVNGVPIAVAAADLDGDGFLDLTASSAASRSVSVLLQRQGVFPLNAAYGLGLAASGHTLADLNGDGVLDLAAFSPSQAMVLLGRPAGSPEVRFRRGDVTADGQVAINDPIVVLNRLFLGGDPLPCDDAADADDDGSLQVNDPIYILSHLFLGGPAPLAPGPLDCGVDLQEDGLGCEASCP